MILVPVSYTHLNVKVPIMDLQNQEDADLKYLANYIYEYVFLHYTEKQWGCLLYTSVCGRIF